MPTLLVVDDEHSILSFVAKVMARRGWAVVEVDNVKEGLEVAGQKAIDVALCDVIMPEAGGQEFARAIRTQTSDVPVVLMTGHPTVKLTLDESFPSWWRPVPLLEKPFTVGELTAALDGALRQRRDGPPPRTGQAA
jgi:DNA-binding NtrC family response regulator